MNHSKIFELLKLIYNKSQNSVILIDEKFKILWSNQTFHNTIGKSFQTITKSSYFFDMFDINDIQNKMLNKEYFNISININKQYYIICFLSINYDSVYYIIEFIHININKLLARHTNIKDMLIAFSAQFRYSISKISNIVELIINSIDNRDTLSHKNLYQQMEVIDINCQGLLRDCSNFVDMAQYSIGLKKLNLSMVEIHNFFDILIANCQKIIIKKNIFINFKHKSVKNCRNLYASLDQEKIITAIANVILNSCSYMRENNCINISLIPNIAKKIFCISIHDHGIGICKDTLKNLFSPSDRINDEFFSKYNSQGIGLILTKYIIELHNGTIEIDSELGVGTNVKITVPFNSINTLSIPLNNFTGDYLSSRFSILNVQFSKLFL